MSGSRRAGKTLIELSVIVAGTAAILATTGQMLQRLSRAERSVRDAAAEGRAEIRLAQVFREDVRAARAAEPVDGGLRLLLDADVIEYTSSENAVVRTAADGARREAYRLGTARVSFGTEGDRFAVISVEPVRKPAARESAPGRFRVVAAIGADRGSAAVRGTFEPVEAPMPASEGSDE